MLVKIYNELRKCEKSKRKEMLKRQSELESARQKIRNDINSGGDITELRPQFTTVDNELTTFKNELKNLGEVYSTHELLETCDSIEAIWHELFPAERYNLAHQLIDKIILYTDHILMDIKHHGLKSLITELRTDKNIEVYQLDPSKLTKILNLVNFSPAIQKLIVEGNAPKSMKLKKLYDGLATSWKEQEREFSN